MVEEIVSQLTEWGKRNKPHAKEPNYFSESHKFGSELRERISYHAEFDVFPTKLINSAAPNEDAKEFKYRKENYKQITKPYWDKALSATYRIFNPQNYSIDFKDEKIKEYFLTTYPKFGNYIEHFKDVIHKMKFADPNAVVVVKPAFIPGELKEVEKEIVFVPDQSAPVTTVSELFPADRVFEFRSDWCLLLTKEKSEIQVAGRKKHEGLIFEYYDEHYIYKLIQYGDQTDWTFDILEYYEHGWEQMPAWKLKGVPYYDPVDILYYSHFMCAVPNLDEAAFLNSTAFAVTNKMAYPTRWYFEDKCGDCTNGYKEDYENPGTPIKCPSCGGTGKKMTFTWGKDYVMTMPENNVTGTDTTQLPTPAIGTVPGSVEEVKYLDEKVKYKCENAFLNLNINITEKPTGVTATEVEDDKDELISFLMQIAGEEFYLLQELINAHTYMTWKKEDVEVKKPTEFRIRNSSDLTEELKVGIEAKLPVLYLNKILDENIAQRFQGDHRMEQIQKVVKLVDPLMMSDPLQISQMANTGIIDKWRSVLHTFIYNFIYLKLESDPNYLEGDIEAIKTELETMAKAIVPAQPAQADDIFQKLRA